MEPAQPEPHQPAPNQGHPVVPPQVPPPPVHPVPPAPGGAQQQGQPQPPPVVQQQPVPANVGQPVPPVPPAGTIRNYHDYYSVIGNDPHAGNYGHVEGDYLAPLQGNSRYAPGVLATRVAAASSHDQPHAMIRHCRSNPTASNQFQS
jgi:hypothetical protein